MKVKVSMKIQPMTREQRLTQIATTLRGPNPWIPGADFLAVPGLAPYLAEKVEEFIEGPKQVRPPHEHEEWQIREAPDRGKFCAACGERVD